MNDEPTLEHIFSGKFPLVDVVFVHGLTGDSRKTWSNEAGDEFWPCWLKSDLDKVSVYTLGYPARLFEMCAKKEMDMFERAGKRSRTVSWQRNWQKADCIRHPQPRRYPYQNDPA